MTIVKCPIVLKHLTRGSCRDLPASSRKARGFSFHPVFKGNLNGNTVNQAIDLRSESRYTCLMPIPILKPWVSSKHSATWVQPHTAIGREPLFVILARARPCRDFVILGGNIFLKLFLRRCHLSFFQFYLVSSFDSSYHPFAGP